MNLQKGKHEGFATLLAFMLIPLSGFSTDIYLPSFPAMAKSLSVSNGYIQLTLTCFLMSYGFGQFFIGSFLDSFGRYKPGLIALASLGISSLMIGLSHDIFFICAMRIIQGISTATVVVGKRAFFVDVYEGDKLKHYLSMFTIVWSCGPIVAPFLGGYLEKALGWQSNFYFLTFYSFALLLLELIFSSETLKTFKPFRPKPVMDVYKMMVTNLHFVLGVIILGLCYSVVMVFSMSGPFVIGHTFGFSSVTIGYSALILGLAWMFGGIIGKKLIHYPLTRKIVISNSLQVVLVAAMLLVSHYIQNLYVLMMFAFLIHINAGFIFNNYFTYCIALFPQNAGMASGLTGGLLYMVTSFLSYLAVSFGKVNYQIDIAWRYFIMIILLSLVLMVVLRFKEKI